MIITLPFLPSLQQVLERHLFPRLPICQNIDVDRYRCICTHVFRYYEGGKQNVCTSIPSLCMGCIIAATIHILDAATKGKLV